MANIRLYPHENTIKLLNEGATAFILPFRKQPDNNNEFKDALNVLEPYCFNAPCQSGDKLYLRETWNCNDANMYFYKADYTEDTLAWLKTTNVKWRSPVTLSNSGCRHVWTDWTIEAVQVKDIKYQQVKACGVEFQIQFNETYPQLNMNRWYWFIEKG